MEYKIMVGNQKYRVKDLGYIYNIGENHQEDIVSIRFDEDTQKFIASIKNPSQHTQYLFENDKLGFAITHRWACKRGHRRKRTRTRDKYHPRWTIPYSDNPYYVKVNNLDYIEWESPNLYQALNFVGHLPKIKYQTKGWYVHIRGILLTMNFTESSMRAYKTNSNTICLQTLGEDEDLINKVFGQSWDRSLIDINITKVNDRVVSIHINSLPEPCWELWDSGQLGFVTEYRDCSRRRISRGHHIRLSNGDPRDEVNYDDNDQVQYVKYNKHWLYRYKQPWLKTYNEDDIWAMGSSRWPNNSCNFEISTQPVLGISDYNKAYKKGLIIQRHPYITLIKIKPSKDQWKYDCLEKLWTTEVTDITVKWGDKW